MTEQLAQRAQPLLASPSERVRRVLDNLSIAMHGELAQPGQRRARRRAALQAQRPEFSGDFLFPVRAAGIEAGSQGCDLAGQCDPGHGPGLYPKASLPERWTGLRAQATTVRWQVEPGYADACLRVNRDRRCADLQGC